MGVVRCSSDGRCDVPMMCGCGQIDAQVIGGVIFI